MRKTQWLVTYAVDNRLHYDQVYGDTMAEAVNNVVLWFRGEILSVEQLSVDGHYVDWSKRAFVRNLPRVEPERPYGGRGFTGERLNRE